MNLQEAAVLLARVQLLDNRTVDRAVIAHWQQVLEDIPLQEAVNAMVTHGRESTDYLMPAHIAKIVRRVRADLVHHYDPSVDARDSAPRPKNFDAMAKAWNKPAEFAREVAVYNTHLAAAGLLPVVDGENIRRKATGR